MQLYPALEHQNSDEMVKDGRMPAPEDDIEIAE